MGSLKDSGKERYLGNWRERKKENSTVIWTGSPLEKMKGLRKGNRKGCEKEYRLGRRRGRKMGN